MKAKPHGDLLRILEKVTIFAGLPPEGLHIIVDGCAVVKHKAGTTIIHEGTPATEIYIVLSGSVKIVLGLESDPLEICEFGPGHCLGEASVIGITDHSASAVVTKDASLLVITRKTLMDVFERDKEFFSLLILNIARELARRLHRTDEILLQYAKRKAV
jgi:CRP/FNR family transcriptional regulator, cyclic AMP receptor protein